MGIKWQQTLMIAIISCVAVPFNWGVALADARLANIATRGLVLTGDEVMIGGLIIIGTEPKTVVIRAIGPSLADFDVPGALIDPQISLFSGSTLIDSNDDWEQHESAAQIPAELIPTRQAEAAIFTTLEPGAYTAIVSGVNESTGVGLVEIFEVDGESVSKLVNIATRGFVGIDDDVMIGGLIISGDEPKTVLLRAIGPSLTNFNVSGALGDPMLRMFSGPTLIHSNDDWQDDANAALIPLHLRPTRAAESALLRTLEPGAYTAIVSGVGGITGVALVEVFEADELPDADTDGDGVPDDEDAFPNDSTRASEGDGDGDGDGTSGNSGDDSRNDDVFIAGVFQPWVNFSALCAQPRTGFDPLTGGPFLDTQGTFKDENNWLRSWSNDLISVVRRDYRCRSGQSYDSRLL